MAKKDLPGIEVVKTWIRDYEKGTFAPYFNDYLGFDVPLLKEAALWQSILERSVIEINELGYKAKLSWGRPIKGAPKRVSDTK